MWKLSNGILKEKNLKAIKEDLNNMDKLWKVKNKAREKVGEEFYETIARMSLD